MNIRQEKSEDFKAVEDLVKLAFESAEHSDGKEHLLIGKLRKSECFVPELCLIAEENDKIIGTIVFTKAKIGLVKALALAPLAVLPEAQGKGVGTALIEKGHKIAKSMGFDIIVVLGNEKYYPRLGYTRASNFGISAPFDVPDKNFMAISLSRSDKQINATVEYAKEMLED